MKCVNASLRQSPFKSPLTFIISSIHYRFSSNLANRTRSLNKFEQEDVGHRIKKEKSKVHSGGQNFLKGAAEFDIHRSKIFKSKSIHELRKILDSRTDFDLSVYGAAIQKSGKLNDIDYCREIMNLIECRNIKPDITTFNQLFQAYTNNKRRDFDKYITLMSKYKIVPDVVTVSTLLGRCTRSGDVSDAETIWNNTIIKYNIKPNGHCILRMIQVYGQNGKLDKAKEYYDQLKQADLFVNSAMLRAYITNYDIEGALNLKQEMENNGQILDIPGYQSLSSFYLKDPRNLQPDQTLKLIEECKQKNQMKHLDDLLLNLKCTAYMKQLEITKDKTILSKITSDIPNERELAGVKRYNHECARYILESHLIYYNFDYSEAEVIGCFENLLIEHKALGYWKWNLEDEQWNIDLHNYSYQQVRFILHYIVTYDVNCCIEEMGYDWRIICGKRLGANASAKLRTGLPAFIMEELGKIGIDSFVSERNPGVLCLDAKTVRGFVERQNLIQSSV